MKKEHYNLLFAMISCLCIGTGITVLPLFENKSRLETSESFFESNGSDDTVMVVDDEPLPPDGAEELIDKRARNSKTFDLGNNTFSWDGTIGSIHYKDNPENESELWKEINNSFNPTQAPWDWEMLNANYHVRVKEDFTAGQIIEFEKQEETVQFQPMALEWTNDLDQIQQVSMPQSVSCGVSNPEVDLLPSVGMPSCQGTIRWNDSYGEGLDFEWKCTATRLAKILEIKNFSKLPIPEQYIIDGGNPVLRLNLIFAPSNNMDIYVDGELWDKKVKKQTFNVIEFRKASEVLWGFIPLKYWGSNSEVEDNDGRSIATLDKRGNKLYVSVRVPYSWLQNATYPIFIDVDVDETIDAGNEDATEKDDGSSFDRTGNYARAVADPNAVNRHNAGFYWDSVNVPQGATISTAYATLYVWSTSYDDPLCFIYGNDVDSASNFEVDEDVTSRTVTGASVDWTDTGIGSGYQNTLEIKTLIKEIVDRGGWVANNNMCILLKGKTAALKRLIFYTYDHNSAEAGKLHIEYSAAANTAPTITGEIPANQSTGIGVTPQLNVTVGDSDSDWLNVTWLSNSSGSWVWFARNSSINGASLPLSIVQTNTNFSTELTKYWWSVNVSDGTDWTNETYSFTTEANATWQNLSYGYLTGGNVSSFENLSYGYLTGGNISSYVNTSYGYLTGGNISSYINLSYGYLTGGNISSFENLSYGYLTGGNITTWINNSYGYLTGGNTSSRGWTNLSYGYLTGGNVTSYVNLSYGYLTGGNVTSFTNISYGYLTGGNASNYMNLSYGYLTGGNISDWVNLSYGYLTGGNVSSYRNLSYGYLTGGNTSVDLAPQFSNENPTNGSTIYVLLYNWSLNISDITMFNWTLECSNGQNNSGTNDTNGTFYLNLSSLITYTTYTVWINASDGYTASNASYIFTVMPTSSTPSTPGGGGWIPPTEDEEAVSEEPEYKPMSLEWLRYSGILLIVIFSIFCLFLYKRRKKKRR